MIDKDPIVLRSTGGVYREIIQIGNGNWKRWTTTSWSNPMHTQPMSRKVHLVALISQKNLRPWFDRNWHCLEVFFPMLGFGFFLLDWFFIRMACHGFSSLDSSFSFLVHTSSGENVTGNDFFRYPNTVMTVILPVHTCQVATTVRTRDWSSHTRWRRTLVLLHHLWE